MHWKILLIIPLYCLLFFNIANGKEIEKFTWVDLKQDKAFLLEIEQAFVDEITPDNPAKVGTHLPYLYKYIFKVGVYKSSAIVIIGHREKEYHDTGDFFTAFNYNLNTQNKTIIQTNQTMWLWELSKLSYFEPTPIPDIVFEYLDCTECEASQYLSSFQYDLTKEIWKVRAWGEMGDRIFIGSDTQIGVETTNYSCLHRIQDFNDDGFEDIAVRCKITRVESHSEKDITVLYAIIKGLPKIKEVKEKKELQKINSKLCEGQIAHPLCKQRLIGK
jgi:hypothetical protein